MTETFELPGNSAGTLWKSVTCKRFKCRKELIAMKGSWQPFSQMINGEKRWIAGRPLDTTTPLHGGNVEYYGTYGNNLAVKQELCDWLNKQGEASHEER